MLPRFEGRTVLITGASRGIGLAIAQRLVSEGAQVVLTGRKQEGLDHAVALLGGSSRAVGVAGHTADATHRAEAVGRALTAFGRLDCLVNNTGMNPVRGPMVDLDLDVARKILEVNVLAALGWVQEGHRQWFGEHGGTILNITSVAGVRPAHGIGMYGATKAMLTQVTQQLATELGPSVRVNALAPGVVKTTFATALFEGRESALADEYPLRRLAVPDDMAGAAAFLPLGRLGVDDRAARDRGRRSHPDRRRAVTGRGSTVTDAPGLDLSRSRA